MFESLLKDQMQNVMKILGQVDGLAPNQTYVSKDEDAAYDTATRTYTAGEVDYPNVPMVLARFTIEEMDSEIIATTDQKAIIASLDLPVEPRPQDKIRTANGTMSSALWVFPERVSTFCMCAARRHNVCSRQWTQF